MAFKNMTKVADIESLKQSIKNGEKSVLMGSAVITTIAVSDNAYLLYYHNYPDLVMHDTRLYFAGVLLNGEVYAKGSANCFNDYRPSSFEVAMAKTRGDIVKAIYDLYDVIEVKPSDFADFELPLAKITAKQILTGKIETGNKFESCLSDDDVLPVFLGTVSVNDAAAAYIADNGAFYAWYKAKEARALELIEKHEAASDAWYKVFDEVMAANAEILSIEVKVNGRSVTAKISKPTLLTLLSKGDDSTIEEIHFLGSGVDVMRQLYGNTYNKYSVITLSNVVSVGTC